MKSNMVLDPIAYLGEFPILVGSPVLVEILEPILVMGVHSIMDIYFLFY